MENLVFALNNPKVNHWKRLWISVGKDVKKTGLIKDNIIYLYYQAAFSHAFHMVSTRFARFSTEFFRYGCVYLVYLIGRNS